MNSTRDLATHCLETQGSTWASLRVQPCLESSSLLTRTLTGGACPQQQVGQANACGLHAVQSVARSCSCSLHDDLCRFCLHGNLLGAAILQQITPHKTLPGALADSMLEYLADTLQWGHWALNKCNAMYH